MKRTVVLPSFDFPPVDALPADLFPGVDNLDGLVLGRPLVGAAGIIEGIKWVLGASSYGCGTNQLGLIHVGRKELAGLQSIRDPEAHRKIRAADKNRHSDPLEVKIMDVNIGSLEQQGWIVRQGIFCTVSNPEIQGVPYSLVSEQRNLRRSVGLRPDEGQPLSLFLGVARALESRAQSNYDLQRSLSSIIGTVIQLGDVSFIPRRVQTA